MRIDILAPHLLRLYVWELLKANNALTTVTGKDGKQLVPIVPVNDEPDMRDSGKPYIIYGFSETETPRIGVYHSGIIAFRVITPTFSELSKIMSVLSAAFEMEDLAADQVNAWTTTQPVLHGCRFGGVCVTYQEAADSPETEGGPLEGTINLRYHYIIHHEDEVKLFKPTAFTAGGAAAQWGWV